MGLFIFAVLVMFLGGVFCLWHNISEIENIKDEKENNNNG